MNIDICNTIEKVHGTFIPKEIMNKINDNVLQMHYTTLGFLTGEPVMELKKIINKECENTIFNIYYYEGGQSKFSTWCLKKGCCNNYMRHYLKHVRMDKINFTESELKTKESFKNKTNEKLMVVVEKILENMENISKPEYIEQLRKNISSSSARASNIRRNLWPARTDLLSKYFTASGPYGDEITKSERKIRRTYYNYRKIHSEYGDEMETILAEEKDNNEKMITNMIKIEIEGILSLK